MNNHYFGVDVNVFLFGKFPDTVNGPHKVNSGDKAKQSQDVIDDHIINELLEVLRDSQ
jgi:hypothetical protein